MTISTYDNIIEMTKRLSLSEQLRLLEKWFSELLWG